MNDREEMRQEDQDLVFQKTCELLKPFNVNNVELTKNTDIATEMEIDSVAILDLIMNVKPTTAPCAPALASRQLVQPMFSLHANLFVGSMFVWAVARVVIPSCVSPARVSNVILILFFEGF